MTSWNGLTGDMQMFRGFLLFLASLVSIGSMGFGLSAFAQAAGYSPCDWQQVSENRADAEKNTSLAGRLGSSRADFEALYGTPKDPESLFIEYDIEGCGPVLVSYDDADFVVSITIASDRPEDMSGTETHEADWPIMPAFLIASSFAPTDMTCKDFQIQQNPYGYVIQECASTVLLNHTPASAWEYVDNTPTYGSFAIVIHSTDRADRFWMMTLSLGFEPEDFPESYQ
jgi:hypothetical protein